MTKYLPDHPGGAEIVVDVSGDKDATADYDDVGHSEEAHQLLAKYYIGDVDASAPVPAGGSASAPAAAAPKPAAVAAPAPVAAAPKPVAAAPAPSKSPASMAPKNAPPQLEEDNTMYIVGAAVVAALGVGMFLLRRTKA